MMKKTDHYWLVLVQWVIAAEWLLSGVGKFTKPDFMNGIASTLKAFEAKTNFEWYQSLMSNWLVPNAQLIGNVVRVSEVGIALALLVLGYLSIQRKKVSQTLVMGLVVALYAGALLNLNFYLAAGWSSPSTKGVNIVMGLVQAILGTYYLLRLKETK